MLDGARLTAHPAAPPSQVCAQTLELEYKWSREGGQYGSLIGSP